MRWLVVALALTRVAAAEPSRVDYVARALAAVREVGADRRAEIDRAVYAAARERCGDVGTPDIACLVAATRAGMCNGNDRCLIVADVASANLRAANDWVDQATRVRLVRSSADYRVALAAELHRRFAALAAELVIAGGDDAAAIDRLCATRDRVVHACRDGDTSCVPSIAYARCAAALVWFVGGSR